MGSFVDGTGIGCRSCAREHEVECERDAVARPDRPDLVSAVGVERDEDEVIT
jgi:hypothetical protein